MGAGVKLSPFYILRFLYVELVLTAFGKCPALAGLQFVGYFLNTFHVSGWRFRILMRTTDFLYFIPICMQVAFHKTDCYFGRIFMQFVFVSFSGITGSLLHELNNRVKDAPIRSINAILHTFVFILLVIK